MDELAVSLVDVRASYEGERHATLNGVSFDVPEGRQFAIVGPNGAGKTTILEVINGLLPITSGTVVALGQPVTVNAHRLRAQIAYVPQNLFFPADTPFIARDVVLAARFAKVPAGRLPGPHDRSLAGDALEAVGMVAAARRPVGRLSGGQQRKILLARAIAQEARLILLDEPTANLDPESKHEVAELVATVRAELGATSLVVSHEAGPLLDASERVIEVVDGCVAGVSNAKATADRED